MELLPVVVNPEHHLQTPRHRVDILILLHPQLIFEPGQKILEVGNRIIKKPDIVLLPAGEGRRGEGEGTGLRTRDTSWAAEPREGSRYLVSTATFMS